MLETVEGSQDMLRIVERVSSRVKILPAGNLLDHIPQGDFYSATMCMNLFLHLKNKDNQKRKEMFEHLCSITKGFVCVNGAEAIDRPEITRLMKKRGLQFTSLSNFFDGRPHIHKKSSDFEFGQLLGYHGADTDSAYMFVVSQQRPR